MSNDTTPTPAAEDQLSDDSLDSVSGGAKPLPISILPITIMPIIDPIVIVEPITLPIEPDSI